MADSDSPAEARRSEGGPPRLARSAGVFGLATITSRILGLARDQVIAYYFGAGDANDAFRVASRIPNLVRDLFAEGAMSAAFVPTFTRQLTLQGREKSWRLASSVINALLIVTGVIVVIGIVFAAPLVRLFAAEFADVPGKIELTIYLTRIVFPFLTLVAVAAVLMGMLNSLGHFFIPALSPAMFNVAVIVMSLGLIPFAPEIGLQPITIVAIATLVGGIGQLAIQWPPLRKEGFRYRPVLDLRDEGLHRVLLLMGPGTIGMAATQINVFVNTVLATGEGTGAVSWLDFAFRLDVPADRPVRRLDRDRGHAGDLAHGRGAGFPAHSIDAGQRARLDAVPQPAGDDRLDRPGAADRRGDLRARRIHGVGHDQHRRRAAAVRDRPGRILDRADHLADVLCHRPQPHSGDGLGGIGARQHRA